MPDETWKSKKYSKQPYERKVKSDFSKYYADKLENKEIVSKNKPKQKLHGKSKWLSNEQFESLPRDSEGNIPLEILIKYNGRIKDTQFVRLTAKNMRDLTAWIVDGQYKQGKIKKGYDGFSRNSSFGKSRAKKRWGED